MGIVRARDDSCNNATANRRYGPRRHSQRTSATLSTPPFCRRIILMQQNEA